MPILVVLRACDSSEVLSAVVEPITVDVVSVDPVARLKAEHDSLQRGMRRCVAREPAVRIAVTPEEPVGSGQPLVVLGAYAGPLLGLAAAAYGDRQTITMWVATRRLSSAWLVRDESGCAYSSRPRAEDLARSVAQLDIPIGGDHSPPLLKAADLRNDPLLVGKTIDLDLTPPTDA